MEVPLVHWLPPSSESRHFYRFCLLVVAVAALVTAFVHWGWSYRTARGAADHDLQREGEAIAWMLDKSPELDRTHRLLEGLVASSTANGAPVEAFIVAGAEEVRASARTEEEKTPWEQVRGRLESQWPGFQLVKVTLHRDPGRPEQATGELYVAAPAPPRPALLPSLLVGLAGAALVALALAPLLLILTRSWFMPLHRIVEANRSSMGGRNAYLMLPSAVAPPGEIREILFHRNHILETLKSREETLGRRTRDMEVFTEFSRQLLATRDAREVPSLALSFLSQGIDCDVACILLLTDESHQLGLRCKAPLSEFSQAEAERVAVTAYYEKSFVQLAGEKLEVSQQVVDPRAEVMDGGFRSTWWAPLSTDGKPLGVLGCMSLSERQFTPESMRLVHFMAIACSLAFKHLHGTRVEGKA